MRERAAKTVKLSPWLDRDFTGHGVAQRKDAAVSHFGGLQRGNQMLPREPTLGRVALLAGDRVVQLCFFGDCGREVSSTGIRAPPKPTALAELPACRGAARGS